MKERFANCRFGTPQVRKGSEPSLAPIIEVPSVTLRLAGSADRLRPHRPRLIQVNRGLLDPVGKEQLR